MQFDRVKGLLIQEFFITVRSYEVILDIFVFPVMSVIVFGFLAVYLSGSVNENVAYGLLTGMLFWQIVFIIQYSVSVGSLWNIWSRNLSNMFIAPVTLTEYLFAQAASGLFKAIFVFLFASVASYTIFHFNVYSVGIVNLIFFFLNLTFFAFAVGIIILGLIFRFGTRIQAFAWGLLPILQPLTAAFYPASIVPQPFQSIAYALPPTYIFEAIRTSLVQSSIQWQFIGMSFFVNIFYFIFSLWFFNRMFNKSKEKGQFARLEG